MMENSLCPERQIGRPSVQRIKARLRLSHYKRLFILVALANLSVLFYGFSSGQWWTKNGVALAAISNLTLINLSMAILVRQQYIINLLFWLATRAPVSWPLSIRSTLAKVYHFGGLHSGGAVSATVWFIIFAISLRYQYVNHFPSVSTEILAVTLLLLALLLLIAVTAHPVIRSRSHNAFERVHRFGGWIALLLFWIQTVVFIRDQSQSAMTAKSLFESVSFWILLTVTFSIVLPWLRLRKVAIHIERPSSHAAVVRFTHGVTPFPGSSTTISRAPLVEWHAFANIPAPNADGFRLIISRAGDWTGRFIDDMPSHVWVKGITTAGVANIEILFKSVVYVATGSGIGPVLPHLLAQRVPTQLIWSAKSPRKTFGDRLVDEILEAQPDAIIWDTDERGKPDLLQLSHSLHHISHAEAVICIANQKLTRHLVHALESRGIPAYGAIWDS
jgi:hypothetical protein